ncbi:galectin-3-binding protein A [Labrus bergylta]|uniref:galectin-3-binding protein A n=1 Tax=Labrus bergylta TaxID=56723 RepID=UPI0033142D85
MLRHRNLFSLWLLLLLHESGRAATFKLFGRPFEPQSGDVKEGDLRLFGSQSASEGRVEVYHNGKWGTVCDDDWDMAEAQVVCRQLKFPGAKSVVIGKDYGPASGPIWLDDLHCKGTENYLSTCSFKGWGLTDCSHKEDVGVICETDVIPGTNTTIDDSAHQLDHSISLSDELGQIFDSGSGCDFLISVQSATGNRKEDGTLEMAETEMCAHKIILLQFPFFNASVESTSITVSISQSCKPYFSSLIRYIYTRKIDVTFTSAQCIHWMASRFGMKQLMEDTGRLFTKILPEDASFQTQLSLYEYAEETGDLVLQENCIQYLAWNYQSLTTSPAWKILSVKLLGAILSRSDLVVQDEYFLLQTVQSWIKEKGNSTTSEAQLDLLNCIRFPMIPAEKLYDLELHSSLDSTFTNMYRDNMLKAFQFNVLLLSTLQSNPTFKEDEDYKPRIYTSEAWSTSFDRSDPVPTRYPPNYRNMRYMSYENYYYYPTPSPYGQSSASFTTSVHYSLIFNDTRVSWQANVFKKQRECSNQGLRCASFPAARLVIRNYYNQKSNNILFRNRLLLKCQDKYICQVQDFKEDMAYIKANGTQNAYPCPKDEYTYHFVVRPEYV